MVSQGLDFVASVRAAWKANPSPTSDSKELDRVHRTAVAQHTSAVRAYRSRLRRARGRVVPMATTAAVTGTVAVVGVTAGIVAAPVTVALAAVSSVTAYSAIKARRLALNPPPEPRAILPAPPPPVLRRGTRGEPDARRLLRIRTQLASMLPAVTTMHPEAGLELALADAEAGNAMNSLVHRLAMLDEIERTLPGTEASHAAAASAEQVAVRLAVGVETYDKLMAAAASMLSAPDLGRSADEVLGPAVDALQAYAHGLTVSAETFGAEPGDL